MPVTQTATTSPLRSIRVICREAWGAEPAAGEFVTHQIDHLTVHHTAVVLDDNRNAPSRIRQHQRYHLGKGWPDLAYHFIIDRNGNVYQGRPINAVGDTATDYDPTGHFLVCCEGDFNVEEVSARQYDTLVAMLAWGAYEFGVDPATIQGHRDLAATSCPGDNLYATIADGSLSAAVATAAGASWALAAVCGDEAAELVGAIEDGTA